MKDFKMTAKLEYRIQTIVAWTMCPLLALVLYLIYLRI